MIFDIFNKFENMFSKSSDTYTCIYAALRMMKRVSVLIFVLTNKLFLKVNTKFTMLLTFS